MAQNPEQAYAELIRRVKEARLLESCSSVLGWDERTYMPHEGSAHRAEQIALLARAKNGRWTINEHLDENQQGLQEADRQQACALDHNELTAGAQHTRDFGDGVTVVNIVGREGAYDVIKRGVAKR